MAERLVEMVGSANGRVTGSLIVTVLLGVMGAFQFGWNIGVTNIPQKTIEDDLGIGGVQWGGVVAAFTVGGFVGAQFSGGVVDRLGRRMFLVYDASLFTVGAGFALAAGLIGGGEPTRITRYALLLVGRVIIGMGSGAATVAVPLYLNEVAASHQRGTLGTLNQFLITIGILVSQAVTLGMNTSTLWGWAMAITGFVGIACLLTSPWLLESPRWLASRGRQEEAGKVLLRLRGYDLDDLAAELGEIAASVASSAKMTAPSIAQVLAHPIYRTPVLIASFLQMAQQLSGINAVFFFSTTFFANAGISNPDYGTLGAGAVNVAAMALAVYLIDRTGRRPLLLVGAIGMMASAAALTGTLIASDRDPANKGPLGAVSIVFVLLFVTFFEVGLGAIPWLIGGEMLDEGPRATGMAIAAAVNWIFTTVIGLGFQPLADALGNYSFLPFVACLAVTTLFTLFFVPETRGRTPQEVMAAIHGGKPVYQPMPDTFDKDGVLMAGDGGGSVQFDGKP